uniref:Bromo adjacent homology domain containing 1 n=1 Tax=Oryzias sinensis TaxID=183150 RepID=A0A8C7YNU2_9TELE
LKQNKKSRIQSLTCGRPPKMKGGKEKKNGSDGGARGKSELSGKKKKDKKDLLRHRRKAGAEGNGGAIACCVLLTRLEEKGVVGKDKNAPKAKKQKSSKVKKKVCLIHKMTKSRPTKTNQTGATLAEPRRRRMASLNAEAVNSLLLYRDSSLVANLPKKGQEGPSTDLPETKKDSLGEKSALKSRPKKQSSTQAQEIDWLSLFAPTPRRQAGLTAATLLKLTSTQYGTKRQKKTKRRTHPKQLVQQSSTVGCCGVCKTEVLDQDWKIAAGGQGCLKHSFHCGSSQGFSFQKIKEEHVETEVSSCYCCSQERCVEYSHPAAITINPHAYTCFPSYYVHFSHPDAPPSAIPPLALCPRSSKRPKLLPGTGTPPSGIGHPVYCCASVEACYGEPCRIKGYSAYSNVIPAITRGGCPFSPGDCTKCSGGLKTDEYPSAISDHHGPSSVPICPNPRILTGCPIPAVPPAGQSVPHIQTPLSDPSQPQPPLHVAKECPQSAKTPSGSRSGARGSSAVNRDKKQKLSSTSPAGQASGKQPKGGRPKSTNGWRSVGVPFEKEVFTVGEESPVLRKCFEGIRRKGDLIRVRDTVLLKSGPRKKSLPYVAKVSALWEEPESGELMMSLFWYYRPEHTQGGRNPRIHCENEIFASRHQDVNSVACIEDKCYVLTLAQYCRFCALVKRRREGVGESATSLMVPPVVGNAIATHHCVPDDVDPDLVYFCRHVYDFRYGRLLKNLQ